MERGTVTDWASSLKNKFRWTGKAREQAIAHLTLLGLTAQSEVQGANALGLHVRQLLMKAFHKAVANKRNREGHIAVGTVGGF